MNAKARVISVLIFLCASALPLSAHHGNASYDYEKTVTIKGTVTAWIFANPHSIMKMDVKDDKGAVQQWVIEGNAASTNTAGWHKTDLKAGDVVTVELMPAKNGAPVGRIRRILAADGTVLLDAHLPSTLNDVPLSPKQAADSKPDASR
jgi:hypothetical protein